MGRKAAIEIDARQRFVTIREAQRPCAIWVCGGEIGLRAWT